MLVRNFNLLCLRLSAEGVEIYFFVIMNSRSDNFWTLGHTALTTIPTIVFIGISIILEQKGYVVGAGLLGLFFALVTGRKFEHLAQKFLIFFSITIALVGISGVLIWNWSWSIVLLALIISMVSFFYLKRAY